MFIDVLDVGQGDAILIQGGGKTVLIDAGDGSSPIVDQLRQLGIRHLDLIVASHPHADHIGGLTDVLPELRARHMMESGFAHPTKLVEQVNLLARQRRVNQTRLVRGQTIRLGTEATLTALFPEQELLFGTRSDANSNSIVLRLEHGTVSALFTGDAEAPTEEALLHAGIQPAQILKVAHHGSEHSTSEAFLNAVAPELALISVGTDNAYGHPDHATLARLDSSGATVKRTDQHGHIRLVSNGSTFSVYTGPLRSVLRKTPLRPTESPPPSTSPTTVPSSTGLQEHTPHP